mmetsp:Transcript_11149/g.26175  ORF Transcript_11149/g.26175 Transcript_11149/m.26175 type:complete len:271 (+) Transcript_11149:152-964(+)
MPVRRTSAMTGRPRSTWRLREERPMSSKRCSENTARKAMQRLFGLRRRRSIWPLRRVGRRRFRPCLKWEGRTPRESTGGKGGLAEPLAWPGGLCAQTSPRACGCHPPRPLSSSIDPSHALPVWTFYFFCAMLVPPCGVGRARRRVTSRPHGATQPSSPSCPNPRRPGWSWRRRGCSRAFREGAETRAASAPREWARASSEAPARKAAEEAGHPNERGAVTSFSFGNLVLVLSLPSSVMALRLPPLGNTVPGEVNVNRCFYYNGTRVLMAP